MYSWHKIKPKSSKHICLLYMGYDIVCMCYTSVVCMGTDRCCSRISCSNHASHLTYTAVPQTVDPKFDEIEQKLSSLETTIRTLIKDIFSWLEELQVCTL